MRKLIILPGICDTFGGTVVTLSLLIDGFKSCNKQEELSVLVQTGSITEKYLQQTGHSAFLKSIAAKNRAKFLQKSFRWINQQPNDYPLLLDNCVDIHVQLPLLLATTSLHLSRRPIYHFCHDLALSYKNNSGVSYNYWGYFIKKAVFTYLAPQGICNSHFTASNIRSTIPNIQGILYQPVDTKRFYQQAVCSPPENLKTILETGAKIILTPSRISQPGILNDKNLSTLIPMLVHLKSQGQLYHCVVIGQDLSPNEINTRTLYSKAENAGVADRFTILPPTFAIEDYYKCADVVVTLAPREPFGRTVVEAIACGIPVVGSCTGGIGEILSHFAPEWKVDPQDPIAAAETIMHIANDANTSKLLQQGRNWVESECSITAYAQKLMKITRLTIPKIATKQLSHS
jgi:glycosyltransferase involved in cell wall biosynthesis